MAGGTKTVCDQETGRYEFRVWGKHAGLRRALHKMCDHTEDEHIEDCYLLVDDSSFNVKIRDGKLKIKQLIDERKGFERWTSERHASPESAPAPFDDLFAWIERARDRHPTSNELEAAVRLLPDRDGVVAVFVEKERTHFAIGDMRAEVSHLTLKDQGTDLQTVSIDGADLGALKQLRKRLGLRDEPNIAVHEAIRAEVARHR